jgi:acyl-CoA reductase-like NAD-dependent aldehyde dehydrogenase
VVARAPDGDGVAAFSPVVLTDVAAGDPLRTQELFAPVVVLSSIDGDADAVAAANSTSYGLSAAVHTRDLERGRRLAEALEAGVVGLNRRTDAVEIEPPFGGRKQSGNGVPEGGRYAYAGMSEYQAIYGLEGATA